MPYQQEGRERALEALVMRRQGLKFREIAARLGFTAAERARQLVKKGERIERQEAPVTAE